MPHAIRQVLPSPPAEYDQAYIAKLSDAVNRYMIEREAQGELVTARLILTDPISVGGNGQNTVPDYNNISQLPTGTVYLRKIPGTGTDGSAPRFLTVVLATDGEGDLPVDGAGGGGGVVNSVFGRSGDVAAQAGDYTVDKITNAVSVLGSYADPVWITSLAWSKITGAPAGGGSPQSPWATDIEAANHSLSNVSQLTTNGHYRAVSNVATADWPNAAIEVRETNLVANTQNAIEYSPRISFHWGSTVASQIGMMSNGVIRTFNNPGTGYEQFACSNIAINAAHNGDAIWFMGSPANTRGLAFHHQGTTQVFDVYTNIAGTQPWLNVLRIEQNGNTSANLSAGNFGIFTTVTTSPYPGSPRHLLVGSETANAYGVAVLGNVAGANGVVGNLAFANYSVAAADKRLCQMICSSVGANDTGRLDVYMMNAGSLGNKFQIYGDGQIYCGAAIPGNGGYLWTGWINTISGSVGSAAVPDRVYASFDSFIRYYTRDDFAKVQYVYTLAWKHYFPGHFIFDASNSTDPSGAACNNTNPVNNWTGTYPTLMGWNGGAGSTFGIRVDSCRIADTVKPGGGTINVYGNNTLYGAANAINFYNGNSNAAVVGFSSGAASVTFNYFSDLRIKRNVVDLQGGLAIIDRLRPVAFEHNGALGFPAGRRNVSVITQELREILPDAVFPVRQKLFPDDEEETEVLAYDPMHVLYHLVLAVKQMRAKLARLTSMDLKEQL